MLKKTLCRIECLMQYRQNLSKQICSISWSLMVVSSCLVWSGLGLATESTETQNETKIEANETILPKDSIFQIKTSWSNQDGKKISFDSFRGKKTILAMVYTSCAHTCPMTISKIEELERKSNTSASEYQIVLASFDPLKDTPAHLKKYMLRRHLDVAHWTFLTAKKDSEVRELAVVLGVSYKKIADGDFSHSNIISLLDQNGVVKSKLDGFESDTTDFLKALKEN